ncbi:helix-turn-helix domain-containing protein [Sinorhizobium medicae]|nr:helix-turn-helix domain-containing protein [Sinorhizobium medicae]
MIDLLIAARRNAGLTQAQVGERLGQRQTFVSKYELGERRLDAAEFITVWRAIDADPHALIKQAEKGILTAATSARD